MGRTTLDRTTSAPRYPIRHDPWAAEYEGAIQRPEARDEPAGAVDIRVEVEGLGRDTT